MSNHKSSTAQPETSPTDEGTGARVLSVRESLVRIDTGGQAIKKNEVGFIRVGQERLMAEVLRVHGNTADMQVFEDTRGVRVGDPVEMSDQMLSVFLGPGLLGQVFDGLQNPLAILARDHGFFPAARRQCVSVGCGKEVGLYPNGFNGRQTYGRTTHRDGPGKLIQPQNNDTFQ